VAVGAGGGDVEGETRAAEENGWDLVVGGLGGDFVGEARAGGEFFGEPFFDLLGFEGGARDGGGGAAQEVFDGQEGRAVPEDGGFL
jgi:hypothetical protein